MHPLAGDPFTHLLTQRLEIMPAQIANNSDNTLCLFGLDWACCLTSGTPRDN
jgi:hypothetical protein